MAETERAIHEASAWKAPGLDGVSAVGWQRLRPVAGEAIFSIFDASLRLGRMPKQFKIVLSLRLSGLSKLLLPRSRHNLHTLP